MLQCRCDRRASRSCGGVRRAHGQGLAGSGSAPASSATSRTGPTPHAVEYVDLMLALRPASPSCAVAGQRVRVVLYRSVPAASMGVGGAVGVASSARGTPRGAHDVAQNEATFCIDWLAVGETNSVASKAFSSRDRRPRPKLRSIATKLSSTHRELSNGTLIVTKLPRGRSIAFRPRHQPTPDHDFSPPHHEHASMH